MNNNVAVYARFSSDNQNPKSIDDQYRKCKEHIYSIFDPNTEVITYADEAISGTRTDRPHYQRMIQDGIKKQFHTLVVDDLSRLSRDALESHRIIREFRYHEIRIISVADGIDTINEGYKLHAGIKALINEEYIDALAKKTFRGLEGRALEGKHCGGRTYGYDVVSLGEDQGSVLKINPEQAEWVKQIFKWYADGYSPRWIASTLNEKGIQPPRRGKKINRKWCSNAIYGDLRRQTGMLNCQTYIGKVIWNKRKWLKTPDGRRVPKVNPVEDWVINERPDLTILPETLWDRVKERQKKINKKSRKMRDTLHKNARTGRGPKYLLSSLLTCGQCGANYIMVNKTDYGCSTYRDRGAAACPNNLRVKRNLLEKRVFNSFKHHLFTKENIIHFEKEVKRAMNDALKARKSVNGYEKDKLKSINGEIDNLINAIKLGIVSPTVQSELKSLEGQKLKLEKQVNIEFEEIERINDIMPAIKKTFIDVLNGDKTASFDHIARLRSRIKMIIGSIRLVSNADTRSLKADITSQYSGFLKLSGLSEDKLNLVAGAGFEPTTFRL